MALVLESEGDIREALCGLEEVQRFDQRGVAGAGDLAGEIERRRRRGDAFRVRTRVSLIDPSSPLQTIMILLLDFRRFFQSIVLGHKRSLSLRVGSSISSGSTIDT